MPKLSLLFLLFAVTLAACGGSGKKGMDNNFYAQTMETAPAQKKEDTGTNTAYASTLSCDQLAVELNAIGREMGQVAVDTPFYKQSPNNLQLAEFITSRYDHSSIKELELTTAQYTQISRLVDDYRSMRTAAYNKECPVVAVLEQSKQWAQKEANRGWRRYDRSLDNMEFLLDVAKDVSEF